MLTGHADDVATDDVVNPAGFRDDDANFLILPDGTPDNGAGLTLDDFIHRQERGRTEPGEGLGANTQDDNAGHTLDDATRRQERGQTEPGEGLWGHNCNVLEPSGRIIPPG